MNFRLGEKVSVQGETERIKDNNIHTFDKLRLKKEIRPIILR